MRRAGAVRGWNRMPRFMLCHRHDPGECRFAFAAWNGYESPLRRRRALASCREGGHAVWWVVEAEDAPRALAQLPPFVGARTEAVEVSEVGTP